MNSTVKSYFTILLVFFSSFVFASEHESSALDNKNHSQELVQHHENQVEHKEDHTDTSPLFFIIIAVIIGALTRFFFQKSPLPFTVVLLLIGLILGVLGRLDYLSVYDIKGLTFDFSFMDRSIDWAAHIDPHLLLYVFLPILIFEAAFAMDVHVFKKTFINSTIMAVPGIIVAIVLTALFVVGLYYFGVGLMSWNWTIALLFGAVISATDPVAVVSILKELGASKKLGTLIEGESLLNDGTAIVIFMVIFAGLTGTVSDTSPILEFFRVSFGGVAIGCAIGWLIIKWVKKVFNDMFVEITAIIAAAYLTFFVAENFFHVSGVLALVAFGLVMASYGRTKISPEVQHFLHEFWELAAFIANTLIFLIVGVVIAERSVFTIYDFVILFAIYIGIFVVRAIVIALFYPLMKKFGYGIDKKDAYVVWYGALRGAIGLALALIVANTDAIDKEIRDQFLFLTAGIVTLTLLVNATTIKAFVEKLGLTKLAPAKALTLHNANIFVQQSAEKNIESLKSDRFLKRANWKEVRNYLPQFEQINIPEQIKEESVLAEVRRRILEKEKSSYWHQFKDGLLGDDAYNLLIGDINRILDEKGEVSISDRGDIENLLNTSSFLSKAQNYPLIGGFAKHLFFEKLTVSYDTARGFVAAQEDSIKLLESMIRSANESEVVHLQKVQEEINENRIEGQTFLRNLGKEYPEIYNAIATREAVRNMLNYEKHTVERLVKRGRIAKAESDKMISDIESRMKQLRDAPPSFELPDAEDFMSEVSWLKDIDHKTFHHVSQLFSSKIFNANDVLLKEGKVEDGMFILVRGTLRITIKNELIDVLNAGATVGEVAALNNNKRTATVTAETPVTVMWISSSDLKHLVADYPEIGQRIWNITGSRYAYYLLKEHTLFNKMSKSQFQKEINNGEVISYNAKTKVNYSQELGVLINGEAFSEGVQLFPPVVLSEKEYELMEGSKVFTLKV
ncbi:MAG: cation:proton antiporter [Flavobacteriales bacterium]|nr:cation:proton antiporter [Flavobacteriales bacterium]MCB9335526.1 cation:proton antiporter [Flavobacteriales bacterium]